MSIRRILAFTLLASTLLACTNSTIAPTYTSERPKIIRIGGDQPMNPSPTIENAGSFCVQISEVWHQDGKTPDGQTLWAKDTIRKVVPCKTN